MQHTAHHLQIDATDMDGNDGLGRYVFLPGSRDRAAQLGARFDDAQLRTNRRALDVHLGQLTHDALTVDVAAVATGMGCPSIDIVASELIQLGARRFLRVGTAGALQDELRTGDIVIADGAVRDEATSDAYVPRGVPAIADPLMSETLCTAAAHLGMAQATYRGLVHTKDALFARELGQGPDAQRNRTYMDLLSRRAGVLASEMEAAHLFILGTVHNQATPSLAKPPPTTTIRCGAVVAIISDARGFGSLDEEQAAEQRLLDLAVAGMLELAAREQKASVG